MNVVLPQSVRKHLQLNNFNLFVYKDDTNTVIINSFCLFVLQCFVYDLASQLSLSLSFVLSMFFFLSFFISINLITRSGGWCLIVS